MGLKLIKAGYYKPKNIVDNSFFESYLDTTSEWIVQRTGIKTRYWEENADTSDMVLESVSDLKLSEEDISKIKVVIVATISPDYIMPSIASIVTKKFNLNEDVFSVDINMACTGFVGGAIMAHGMLENGECAIIIGADKLSKLLDKEERSTVALFGDGSGAVLFEKTDGDFFNEKGTIGSDDLRLLRSDEDKIYMNGQNVYRFGIEIVPKCIKNLLNKSNMTIEEIDHVVLHQANIRIINSVARKLGSSEKYYTNIETYGNTSSASIPICLGEMQEKDMLRERESILMFGFGAGLSFAGIIVEV